MNNSATTRRITQKAFIYNADDKGHAILADSNLLISNNPEEQFFEMKAIARRNSNIKNWAATGYVSPIKEIGDKLTDKELTDIAIEALYRIGITPLNQYKLDIHNSSKHKHIHFIANRVNIHGKCTVKAHNIGRKFGNAIRDICKERGIMTDVEITKIKKDEMLKQLTETMPKVNNLNELAIEMKKKGYELIYSSNQKDGISGMRVVRIKDKNTQTERIYKPGYKLSEISRKLNIAEIKKYFDTKDAIQNAISKTNNSQGLLKNLYANGYEIRKSGNSVYIYHKEYPLVRNGFFYQKELGFPLSAFTINPNALFTEKQTPKNDNNPLSKSLNELIYIINIQGYSSYSKADEELFKRRKKRIK